MAYDEKFSPSGEKQNIIIENRSSIVVSGVMSVVSFDENTIITDTVNGGLYIHGTDLHIEHLNLDNGEIRVIGTLISLEYDDAVPQSGGLFSRFFK